MLTLELFEELQGPPEPTLIDALRDFLPIAVKHLKIKELPKIKLLGDIETDHMPSFGKFSNDDRTVHLGIKNRHPNDILRTLAHELTHYAQGEHGKLDADSGATGSPEEDQANAEAGVVMREFNQQFPQYMSLKPIVFEEWSQKYKKSINCSNPKGFSQKAHCAGRKKNTNEAEDNLEENQEKYILYLNDKPVSVYTSSVEANNQAKMVAQKYPNARITVKKEVCTLSPVQLAENLRDWFKKDKWVRMDTKGNIKGPCAREPGEGKPKCLPQAKAHALGKKGRASAAQRKRREDPNPERSGKAINVNTKEDQLDEKCWKGYHKEGNKKMFGKTVPNCVKNEDISEGIPFDQCPSCGGKIVHESQLNEKQDACYHKVKSRYKVWPSAYASGALVQCRKKGAANWGNKSKNESAELGKHCSVKNAVPELKAALTKRKTELKNADAKVAYDKIDKIMTRIAQTYNISGQKLHDLWTERYGEIPDTWVLGENYDINGKKLPKPRYTTDDVEREMTKLKQEFDDLSKKKQPQPKIKENFADGKGPGKPGDSQRHGIPKGATIAQLEKAARAPGRKGQLARWQINMRRGKKK